MCAGFIWREWRSTLCCLYGQTMLHTLTSSTILLRIIVPFRKAQYTLVKLVSGIIVHHCSFEESVVHAGQPNHINFCGKRSTRWSAESL